MAKRTETAEPPGAKGRLEARIPLELKSQLERAAALKGMNLSSFVIRSMERVAAEVIAAHEQRELSLADQEAFFDALMDPPDPNSKMLAASRRYLEP